MILDENTSIYLDEFQNNIPIKFNYLKVNSGEKHKNLKTVEKVWDFLNENLIHKNDVVIIVGGGMVGDLASFATSTYKRGVNFILFPTTLLSMVDSSIGGKTGINYHFLKNNIGTFSIPEAVFYSSEFLKSLPKNELFSGLAEVYKHCIIKDRKTWNYLKNSIDQLDYDYLIKTSYLLKSEIVKKDPFEKNTRKKLNFGHTIAHAIESYLLERNKPILHGFAVAKGIIIESYIAYRQNLLSQKEFEEIEHQINFRFGNYFNFEINVNELIKLLKFDKKNTCKTINFSLPTAIGNVTVNHEIELNKVKSFLVEFLQND
mgnify:FL=1|tara:strand:- start:49 stop:999 length:951 start_codon:yes stop_codon:yes gene_type:complete